MIFTGQKVFGVCQDCGKVVRIDKFLFGSMHLCLSPEERQAKQASQVEVVPMTEDQIKDHLMRTFPPEAISGLVKHWADKKAHALAVTEERRSEALTAEKGGGR